jgi:hypothetical protein
MYSYYMFMYSYFCVYVSLLLCLFILVMFMYSSCYVYIFLLLRMFRSVYSVSLCCSVYCLCVTVYCTVLLPPGVNPAAVNIHITSYINCDVCRRTNKAAPHNEIAGPSHGRPAGELLLLRTHFFWDVTEVSPCTFVISFGR